MSRTWALLQPVDAPDANNPAETVMARWRIVQTPWWGVLLHRLDKPDSRSTLHDHPWPFLSLILRGGYTEEFGRTTRFSYRPTSPHEGRVKERVKRTWRAGSLHRMRSRDPHTIVSLLRSPTWTLVLTGPRARNPAGGTGTRTAGPPGTSTPTPKSSPPPRPPARSSRNPPSAPRGGSPTERLDGGEAPGDGLDMTGGTGTARAIAARHGGER
jgi:hypothetical protein